MGGRLNPNSGGFSEMKVTAFNNGGHHKSGGGFGLRIPIEDRDQYFIKSWGSVFVHLPNKVVVEININKSSFWNKTCGEIINIEVGRWMLESHEAPWCFGAPPKFDLLPLKERHFTLIK